MPTGYTAAIKDGISFQKYAMDCARAFGACIMLRDESGGGEKIPERFEPSPWHAQQRAIECAQLDLVRGMTVAECDAAAASEWEKAVAYRKRTVAEHRDLRQKYEAMLAEVNAWEPPTPDHARFHEFMREQIEQSIKFDCGDRYYPEPEKFNGMVWRAKEIERLERSIAYHERENATEIKRTDESNAWVGALRESLMVTP